MSGSKQIELILFEHEADRVRHFADSGIGSFLVDLELMGKDIRQLGFDTDISPGSLEALRSLSLIKGIKRWCRLNAYGAWSEDEVEKTIDHGANVLILPMVRDIGTIEMFLGMIDGRCQSCVMLETREALSLAGDLDALALDYAYFGLNDYRIDMGSDFLFEPVLDGTIEAVRKSLKRVKFGFGGLTDIRQGHPVPSVRFLEEMERLDCDMTFLRRSFKKDNVGTASADIVRGIDEAWHAKRQRPDELRRGDRAELVRILTSIRP